MVMARLSISTTIFYASLALQVYLPCIFFVTISCVSFLVRPELVPGRMALLVTLFLMLVNIFNTARKVLQ